MDSDEEYYDDYEDEEEEENKENSEDFEGNEEQYDDGEMEEEISESNASGNFSYSIIEPQIVDGNRSKCILELHKFVEEYGLKIAEYKLLKVLQKTHWNTEAAKNFMKDNLYELNESINTNPIDPTTPFVPCEICWSEEAKEKMVGLECQHLCCVQCFREYLKNSVKSDVKAAVFLTCPSEGCPCIVSLGLFERHLDYQDLDRLKRFTRRCFVDSSYNLTLCIQADCQNTFFLKFDGSDKEKLAQADLWCSCLASRCLKCEREAHMPVPCGLFEMWLKKIEGKDDSVTNAWIKSNTKPCPKCKVQIEKNQGCMHMTCMKCRYEFCWLCMGDWKQHGAQTGGFYSCNQFKGDDKSHDVEKKELEKFNHYSSRYIEHAKSCKIAKKKLQELKLLFENNPKFNCQSSNMFDPFISAQTTSLHARQTVTCSYGLSFQVKNDVSRDLLDMNLYYLEKSLENLDKFLENIDFESWFVRDQHKFSLSKKFSVNRGEIITLRLIVEENFKNFINDSVRMDFEKILSAENPKKPGIIEIKQIKMEEEGWNCPKCTLVNASSRQSCDACLFRRGNNGNAQVRNSNVGARGTAQARGRVSRGRGTGGRQINS